ncbi:hypothetical protein ACHAPA_012225 [Fusarium lateritium]
MTALVKPTLYNSLPSLAQAEEKQQFVRWTLGFNEILSGPVRDVFLKHSPELLFSAYLQHAHHTLRDGEAVVKVEGTAHVMADQDIQGLVSFGNKVIPSTWMTIDGKVLPMEYSILPNGAVAPMPSEAFLADLTTVLAENYCEGLLGLDTIGKHDWVEASIGQASVVVPSNGNQSNAKDFIDVSFAFDPDRSGFKVHGRCNWGNHTHSRKPPKPQ